MPEGLKGSIESRINTSIHSRWKWKGLAVPRIATCDTGVGYVIKGKFLLPEELELEFVDNNDGAVLWRMK